MPHPMPHQPVSSSAFHKCFFLSFPRSVHFSLYPPYAKHLPVAHISNAYNVCLSSFFYNPSFITIQCNALYTYNFKNLFLTANPVFHKSIFFVMIVFSQLHEMQNKKSYNILQMKFNIENRIVQNKVMTEKKSTCFFDLTTPSL